MAKHGVRFGSCVDAGARRSASGFVLPATNG